MTEPEPELLASVEGALGRLVLNRPRSLNALTPGMIGGLNDALDRFADDPTVAVVSIEGAGERGLCAGGDIKVVYEGVREQTLVPVRFWTHEYRMNNAIASYPKPFVAWMDGLVLGGGLGVSMHGSHRIVTPRSTLAMPETAIGLAPDVGALYWYARMPGGVGTYAALTGHRFNAGDALRYQLADACYAVDSHPPLLAALRTGVLPDAELTAGLSAEPPIPTIGRSEREWIDACFTADTVEEIADRLAARPEPAARQALATLRSMSPTAVKVSLAAIRRAAQLPTIREVLDQDLRVSTAATQHPDLVEGIRAMVVDKDRQPRWRPGRWEQVSDAEVASFFNDPGADAS